MFRSRDGRNPDTGKWPLVFNPRDGCGDLPVDVPCGQCIWCRLDSSRQKTVRLTHELDYWDVSSFITLTYGNDNLVFASSGLPTLTKGQHGHMTLFFKRLRKHFKSKPLKYFQCAEYGDRTSRPHYHVILFGEDFSHDRQLVSSNPDLYYSPLLDRLWSHGGCRIGTVTWDSVSYVADYCVKKLTGDQGAIAYDSVGLVPPFATSSEGIGKQWITDWLYDVYPRDFLVVRGHKQRPPRYYDDFLLRHDADLHRSVVAARQEVERSDDYYLNAISSNLKKSSEINFWKNPKI